MRIFILICERACGGELLDRRVVGVYSSEEAALAAQGRDEQIPLFPGYVADPNNLDEYQIISGDMDTDLGRAVAGRYGM